MAMTYGALGRQNGGDFPSKTDLVQAGGNVPSKTQEDLVQAGANVRAKTDLVQAPARIVAPQPGGQVQSVRARRND